MAQLDCGTVVSTVLVACAFLHWHIFDLYYCIRVRVSLTRLLFELQFGLIGSESAVTASHVSHVTAVAGLNSYIHTAV